MRAVTSTVDEYKMFVICKGTSAVIYIHDVHLSPDRPPWPSRFESEVNLGVPGAAKPGLNSLTGPSISGMILDDISAGLD